MRRFRLMWLAVTASAAVLAACGEGRAIFNVDVLSFIGGQGNDTLHYTIPPGTSASVDNPPVKVTLLQGLGNSTVDSVTLTVGALVENLAGGGQVKYQIFFDTLAAVYTTPPYAEDSTTVSGVQTDTLLPISVPLLSSDIFGKDSLFVGVRVVVNADPGPAMDGRLRLSEVRLRIVLQDHVFQ